MTENMSGGVAKDGKLSMEDAIEIYQKVLEDLVQVNSLFTTAVFLGISFASAGQRSFLQRKDSEADRSVAKRLLVFEVIAFGCYLLSSLVTKALKVHLTTYLILKTKLFRKALVTVLFFLSTWGSILGYLFLTLSMVNIIQVGLFFLSTWGSILGYLFLTLSMVNIIQVGLGKILCEVSYTFQEAWSLIAIVSLALLIYIACMMCTMDSLFRKCK